MTPRTADPHIQEVAARLRSLASQIVDVIERDDGDGMCISDLQFLMHEFRPLIADIEVLEQIPSSASISSCPSA